MSKRIFLLGADITPLVTLVSFDFEPSGSYAGGDQTIDISFSNGDELTFKADDVEIIEVEAPAALSKGDNNYTPGFRVLLLGADITDLLTSFHASMNNDEYELVFYDEREIVYHAEHIKIIPAKGGEK